MSFLSFPEYYRDVQHTLQDELNGSTPRKLETLAAQLLGKMLGVEIALAKSGFQYGADAGTAGRQGRRLRIECKKYAETTANRDRELLGEIDQAVSHDESIEAWILVATRSVSEQLQQSLEQHGERLGVPIVVLSWEADRVCTLAALCSTSPDLVSEVISHRAGELALELQAVSQLAVKELERDLQSWCLGFEKLRQQSHEKIKKIWESPKISNAALGQDAAGGAQRKKIIRPVIRQGIETWWREAAQKDAPLLVTGSDGVGKTWATIDWLINEPSFQPIVFVIPSSAATVLNTASEVTVKRLFAERLYEMTGKRDVDHWLRRLDRLLQRPPIEGPVITVIFDGINQEPSIQWLQVLKILQSPEFSGLVRTIASSRPHFYTDRLSSLKGLVEAAVTLSVDVYGIDTGGEFDQMLSLEGLTRLDLPTDLIDLARTPRLFKLVIRLRDRLINADKVTVHHLLWEYGRDTLGERAGRSFSEQEWQVYLQEIALELRRGIHTFSIKSLSSVVSRADLTSKEVYARLSDIVDGRFSSLGSLGKIELIPAVVAHSLAAALLAHLDPLNKADFETVEGVLTQWLDPISGLDQRAEILRASVAIVIEQGDCERGAIPSVLATAWLQTQNLTDQHRKELGALSENLIQPLIDAIAHSTSHTHASSRVWAINALREVPRTNIPNCTKILIGLISWLRVIPRSSRYGGSSDAQEIEKKRKRDLTTWLGSIEHDDMAITGQSMKFIDTDAFLLPAIIPSILEGSPLSSAIELLHVAAIYDTFSENSTCIDGLRWLLILNELDPLETATAIRNLVADLQKFSLEPNVHPGIRDRITKRLLGLTGCEVDEIAAQRTISSLDYRYTYEDDYLPSPGNSSFSLERRHAELVLSDTSLPLRARLNRTKEFWLDPTFSVPPKVIPEIRRMALEIDISQLSSSSFRSSQDHNLEEIEPVLAVCAPDLLARIGHQRLLILSDSSKEQRYWRAISSTHHLLLSDDASRESARTLRMKFSEIDSGNELYASSQLLMLEIQGLDWLTQASQIIDAGLKTILIDFNHVLNPPIAGEAEQLFKRYSHGNPTQQHLLLCMFSFGDFTLNDEIWGWLEQKAQGEDIVDRGIAFRTLTRLDPNRFARFVLNINWTWKDDEHFWVNHYGSGALISGGSSLPFEQVAPRIAPWRLLEAARLRGEDSADIQLAAAIFGTALTARAVSDLDPGSDLTIHLEDWKDYPAVYSLSLRKKNDSDSDTIGELEKIGDVKAQQLVWDRATATAKERINIARVNGAKLYLANVACSDIDSVWTHAPEAIDVWLEGLNENSADFKRRVRLAEGAFFAICESLLNHDPKRGVLLWWALRHTTAIRHLGHGDIDELVHIAFRVTDSPEVNNLRLSLIEIQHCFSDKMLAEITFVALFNKRDDWVQEQIKADLESSFSWRHRRAIIFDTFLSSNMKVTADDWPIGPALGSMHSLRLRAKYFHRNEAFSYHWYQQLLAADTEAKAYVMWVLFLNSANLNTLLFSTNSEDDIRQKLTSKITAHMEINRSAIRKRQKYLVKDLDEMFLGRRVVNGVGPWI